MFKDRLKELREKERLSQYELADKIYVSRSTIAKWENGNGIPSDVNIKSLCNFFNVDKEWLLDKNDLKNEVIKQNNAHLRFKYILFLVLLTLSFAIFDYFLSGADFNIFWDLLINIEILIIIVLVFLSSRYYCKRITFSSKKNKKIEFLLVSFFSSLICALTIFISTILISLIIHPIDYIGVISEDIAWFLLFAVFEFIILFGIIIISLIIADFINRANNN